MTSNAVVDATERVPMDEETFRRRRTDKSLNSLSIGRLKAGPLWGLSRSALAEQVFAGPFLKNAAICHTMRQLAPVTHPVEALPRSI